MGHDLTWIAGEQEKEVELTGCQVHGPAHYGDRVRGRVDMKVARIDSGVGYALGGSSQVGANACKQFLNAERLGDVVVGPGIERLHLGAFLIPDGENEDRCFGVLADRAADIDAAHVRHHQVCHHKIRRPFFEETERFLGIVCGPHLVALMT